MKDGNILSKVTIFSMMKNEDLDRLANLTLRHDFNPGDLIIKEGDRDRRLFVIIKGIVEVIKDLGGKNERRAGVLGPYRYFGEMSLIDELVRSASVIATEKVEILSLDHFDLQQEIQRYPTIAMELLRTLSRRIRVIEKGMISSLGTLLPICSNCKKIRDLSGAWIPIEKYISDRSEAEFSHGICPKCTKLLYPQYADRLSMEPGMDNEKI